MKPISLMDILGQGPESSLLEEFNASLQPPAEPRVSTVSTPEEKAPKSGRRA